VAVASALLAHKAEVDSRDDDGMTPLLVAALSGHREMAALLLDHGADVEARDAAGGATPLYQAAAWGRTAVIELLIARGADVNARNRAGKTPLAAALANGSIEAARILREHGGQ
jgi:ankyrin repeat protein